MYVVFRERARYQYTVFANDVPFRRTIGDRKNFCELPGYRAGVRKTGCVLASGYGNKVDK